MNKKLLLLFFLCMCFGIQAQTGNSNFRSKVLLVKKDSIQLDSVAINPNGFKVFDATKKLIPPTNYSIDFAAALLIIDSNKYSSILVEYFVYPEFLTKTYTPYSESLIIEQNTNDQVYRFRKPNRQKNVKIFEGLETRGFISRGLTSGNNQNAVTNSALDLEISGKLSKNVSLRARIFDTNIPIQENGYSQNFTDFDRIYMEIFSDNWGVRAGDISIENRTSFFVPFTKQIAGLRVNAKLNDEFGFSASGAVVRGKFNNFRFVGVEGNQGPYKLFGQNNEAAILIIEGSDRVFVNGVPIERGENKDYVINYNLGEIVFNTTYPINNDMRITVEFQYSDRNFTRFISYNEAEYKGEKFEISAFFYSENDAKNQPLQQSLSDAQKQILANAGNNTAAMIAESAFRDPFDENKILYRRTNNGTTDFFEYSTNPNDVLFTVTFSNVGQNNGDYVLDRSTAIGNIFVFVGVNQGDFQPIVRLTAPNKSQFAVVQSSYAPTEKTKIETEIALSNNDPNLFSDIDNDLNDGLAAKVTLRQNIINKKWKLNALLSHEYAHKNFRTLQRWESIEFNRDWNLLTNNGTKNYFKSELELRKDQNNYLLYRFNHLNYIDLFNGNKHDFQSNFQLKNTRISLNSSFLTNTSTLENNSFFRTIGRVEHFFNKSWVGLLANVENNTRENITTQELINTSHKYKDYEAYVGIGDSTKVYAKIGFNYRDNDSIRSNRFEQINNRKTYYIQSRLIQNKDTKLSLFANFRETENQFSANEKSLNSRLIYQQKLFNDFVSLNTTYETSSGNVARQDFIYVRTEPGLGFYTWIDYNGDGIKDFNEFEIAQFQDQAEYLRLPKPNLRFVPTQKAKWQQNIFINFKKWADQKGLKKTISHFSNQTFLLASNEQERTGNSFQLNPFDFEENSLVSLQLNFRNTIHYNRGMQNYSTSYTYGNSKMKQQFLIGNQDNDVALHQLDFAHKFSTYWLVELMTSFSTNSLNTENFADRNYELCNYEIQPKLNFLYSKDYRFSGYYHFKKKENSILNQEELNQQKFGLEYFFLGKKNQQVSAMLNYYLNDFRGNPNSPVAYQMLEGLQAGKNLTWNLVFNKKLNSFLNLNLNYFGRKSENVRAIHSGSVQLRADF
ncbi:MAG: hypothetical protein CMB99_03800 [Flavobacteriaceae bacterium]|nr:hypothetical protein [Flavobacteriaceae bacterium]